MQFFLEQHPKALSLQKFQIDHNKSEQLTSQKNEVYIYQPEESLFHKEENQKKKKKQQLTGMKDQLRKFMEKIQKPETHKHNTDRLAANNTNIQEKFCVKAKNKSCLNFLILVIA